MLFCSSISDVGCNFWRSDRQAKLATYSDLIGFPIHSINFENGSAAIRLSNQRLVYSSSAGKFVASRTDELYPSTTRTLVDESVFQRMHDSISVHSLSIAGLQLEDDAWRMLCLLNLSVLDASMTNVSNTEVLNDLLLLKNLSVLDLSATTITDAGLARIKELKKLRVIRLNELQISGTGLKYLAENPSLRRIEIVNTLVTDEMVIEYRCAGGNAEVVRTVDFRKDGGVL